ncbi:helix-turn-helix domain-containing protein [Streptomyces sclerotialus]|uniref:helix-turn-helix domain-containing protein n=1 Tax=Streptomyces sclerotialus TaxID=1957 RepID=UPI0004C6D615
MGLNDEVGRRLRELRQQQRLSLSELARRSGVGKGTLSELEGGQRNPTLETLYALTTALNSPLSAVLSDHPRHAFQAQDEGVSGSAVTAALIERFEEPPAATDIFRIRIAAGSVQESAAHITDTSESLMVLTGTAVVGDPAEPQTAGPGEYAHWRADTPHLYSAPDGDVHGILFVRYPHAAPVRST